MEVGTGFEPVYTDLQSVASPLGHSTRRGASRRIATLLRADDEARTRDLNLGKVALYQLSYVRLLLSPCCQWLMRVRTVADRHTHTKTGAGSVAAEPRIPLPARVLG